MMDILTNKFLWGPVLSSAIAQLVKVITSTLREGRLNFSRMVETGGMPSSHSASVMTLTTMIGLSEGFKSPLFGAVAFFSFIIMYDAAGVRKAAGEQAKVLNVILDQLMKGHPISEVYLKELLGHTPLEVLVGAVMGIILGVLFHLVWS